MINQTEKKYSNENMINDTNNNQNINQNMKNCMIHIDNISINLGNKEIINNLTFQVNKGDILSIMGVNGVGKTTILSGLLNLLPLSGGQINKLMAIKSIGYVPQSFLIPFEYKVIDIVLMGRSRHVGLFGSPSPHDYDIAYKYLDMVGCRVFEDRPFSKLSGGQKQLVMIAQTLSSECDLLILDEPCSALDYKNQSQVLSTVQKLQKEMGITVIFTTHAPQHALSIATHVLLLHSHIKYQYGPREILNADNLTDMYDIEIGQATFADQNAYTLAPRFDKVI